jgi:diguanylate cyclase (GGDEF)-like protein/PAS domain S-box-containing protein
MFTHQRDFLYTTETNRTVRLANVLASSSASWVLANDLAGLQEVILGFSGTQDLKFANVLSMRGEVLGSTNPNHIGRFTTDPISRNLLTSPAQQKVLIDQSSLLDVAVPIMAGERHIGWARVEMTRASSNANLWLLGLSGFSFSLLAVVAAFLVATWLARRLTRNLYHLMKVTNAIEQGRHDVRSTISNKDEVGKLAHGFNRMVDALSDSELKLGRLNQFYAAWAECSEIIVRENNEQILLNSICQILANRVPFELVWIGVPDQGGWIYPVASGGAGLDYLSEIKVSIDAEIAEGNGPLGTTIREGMPNIVNDFLHEKPAYWVPLATKYNYHSVAAFPIFKQGRPYGGIAVYSAELNFFNAELITLINGLADDISFALTKLELERQKLADVIKLEQAAQVFEHSKEGILVTDANKKITSVNKSFTEITGFTPEEAIGQNPRLLASGRHDAAFFKQVWEALATTGSWQGELWNRRKSGEIYPESLTIISVKGDAGAVINYIGIFGDISERKLAEERIQQLAHYDVLTGLPNRLLFSDRLEQSLINAQRNQSKVALLFLDLDRFKQINDTLGHDIGDALLKMVAQRLISCVREQDTLSRQGGDEFIAVLPDADIAGAELVAAKMLDAIIQPYLINQHEFRISSSIGIAVYPDQAQDAESLIKYADVAMYQAKDSGRNKYLRFDPSMNASSHERLQLENGLRTAVDRQELRLYYQPQIDLIDGRIIGCEALVRWQHPELGMISPATFIPLAEETGLIMPISDWVLEEALRQARVWRDAGLPEITVAVNLSALQFRQRILNEQVGALLKKYKLPPHVLDLELTESILMQGIDSALSMLHELSIMGVGLSIDDFGTGYSSLSYLKRFPIQKLKIDQSFVRDITTDSNDATMVKTIILMAHSLKLHVIAEGVETEAQADFLRASGCEQAQGYLFGRPVAADEFTKLLQSKL